MMAAVRIQEFPMPRLRTAIGLALLASAVVLATPLAAAQCPAQRVSLSSTGGDPNGSSLSTVISPDGRWAAFSSTASNIVPGDTNGKRDVFLSDLWTQVTIRVSVDSGGGEGNGNSSSPQISDDARYVSFESLASNLVAGDGNGSLDVFVHDVQSGTTALVSRSTAGVLSNGLSGLHSMAASGDFISFWSTADNLVPGDTNGTGDVFLRDRVNGTLERVSVSTSGGEGNAESGDSSISHDGRLVAFGSIASNLVPDDANGFGDCFLRDRQTGVTTRISVSSTGEEGNGGSSEPQISADSSAVTFWGDASNLVSDDTNGSWDVFVHELANASTTRVSVSSAGAEGDGNSANSFLSAEGRYVTFYSFASNLVSGDSNGFSDVFLHDRFTGITNITTVGVGGVPSDGDSFSTGAADPSGRMVPLESQASNLVADDGNGETDAFVLDCVSLSVSTYCTAKVNSQLCTPAIGSVGFASATDPVPFLVDATMVLNNKLGLLFYGYAPASTPFQGGIKCVASPVKRTPTQSSGGSPPPDDCSGTYSFDFNARIQSGVEPGLVVGVVVYCQYWYRDPPTASATGLTDALQFTILP
jgi:hypothetical protein